MGPRASPNVLEKRKTLVLDGTRTTDLLLSDCIQKAPDSNLGRDTDYSDRYFYSVPTLRYRGSTLNYATTTSFHILCNS